MYGEDVYFGRGLNSSQMVHAPTMLVLHEGNASSRQGSEFYEERMTAAHWILANKLSTEVVDKFILYGCRFILLGLRAMKMKLLKYRELRVPRAGQSD